MSNETICARRALLQHILDGGYCKAAVMEELCALLAQHRKDDQAFNTTRLLARAAIVLGLNPDNTSWFEIVEEMEKAAQHQGKPVAQVEVLDSGGQLWIALNAQWLPVGVHSLYTRLSDERQAMERINGI